MRRMRLFRENPEFRVFDKFLKKWKTLDTRQGVQICIENGVSFWDQGICRGFSGFFRVLGNLHVSSLICSNNVLVLLTWTISASVSQPLESNDGMVLEAFYLIDWYFLITQSFSVNIHGKWLSWGGWFTHPERFTSGRWVEGISVFWEGLNFGNYVGRTKFSTIW